MGGDFIQSLFGILAGRFSPFDGFLFQKRQHMLRFHDGGFFRVDDSKQGRNVIALIQRHLHIMQKLREHGVAGSGLIFRLEPDFVGLNIDEVLADVFKPQRLEIKM